MELDELGRTVALLPHPGIAEAANPT